MFFKNILFGLGGTAVIGGVGYGIYAASQFDNKDVKESEEDDENEEEEGNRESGTENERTGSISGDTDNLSEGGSGR